jgi:hypothetical protein
VEAMPLYELMKSGITGNKTSLLLLMENHSSVTHTNFEFTPYNFEICKKLSFV